jgi:hypothetical protein
MNNNPTFRNLRMVIVPLLFVWLLVALWPMRHEPGRGHSIFPDTPATAAGPVAIDLPCIVLASTRTLIWVESSPYYC